VHEDSIDQFTQLGTTNHEVCRHKDGTNSQIGNAYWQLTGINSSERCAALCIHTLAGCKGFEYQVMSAPAGRCELWYDEVISVAISSSVTNGDPVQCYKRTKFSTVKREYIFVAWTLNINGLAKQNWTFDFANKLKGKMRDVFSASLSNLNNRSLTVTRDDVVVRVQTCNTVAATIGKLGENVIPLYEALAFHQSNDNPNQGSKREEIRQKVDEFVQNFWPNKSVSVPRSEGNARIIGFKSEMPELLVDGCGLGATNVTDAANVATNMMAALTAAFAITILNIAF